MLEQKIGIVGFGHVGTAMQELFPDAVIYDEPLNIGDRISINQCNCVFICVPTPPLKNGACDTSIVEEVIGWIEAPLIVIRSTVPVGFTDNMKHYTQKHIVFQPEYYGETPNHPFANPYNPLWITLGGDKKDTQKVANIYKHIFTPEVSFYFCEAKVAELAKYMENSFLALKVSFCNQFYDIAKSFDIEYDELREVWLADPRINRSHTFVYEDNRGFGGSCLPKDLSSIIYQSEERNIPVPLLEAIQITNSLYKA